MGVELFLRVLLVTTVPIMAEIAMEFRKQPQSVVAPVGDKVTFECAVMVPGDRLFWRWRPEDQPEDKWTYIPVVSDRDKLNTKLVITVNDDASSGFYQCLVWYGGVSLASAPARLLVAKVDLSKNSPERRVITAPLHNTVVLHCKEPASHPPAILSWWKEDDKGSKISLDSRHGVLVIHNATAEDSGSYGCTATNALSNQVLQLPEKTYLKVQHEGSGGVRFLESEDYVGTVDSDGVLTLSVRPNESLRIWCGAVGTPPPQVEWSRQSKSENLTERHRQELVVSPFTPEDEGIYSCTANGIRRSWKVIALQAPHWEGFVASVNASEGAEAHIACGTPFGQPPPTVYWLLNSEPLKNGKGMKISESDLVIERTEKRHAGIVQCVACNALGCAYDAALLAVVPAQISDQEYSVETGKPSHYPSQPPKRHNRKNSRKHTKAVMIPPSRPNVTRLSDESVMVSWTNSNHGLPIQFFKVQYKEATNSSNTQWHTANYDIPPYIHSYEIDGLVPDRYYKFRIAAVYSNQDNNQGRSSARFYLQRGGVKGPKPAVLERAVALSPHTIQLNWTWSSGGGIEAEGFYVYYRAVSSAGEYEKVTAPGGARARSIQLDYMAPDTAYELKVQAFTEQAPSEFSTIMVAKTLRLVNATTTEAPAEGGRGGGRAPAALVTAGGALGVAVLLLLLLAVVLLLCRRARRPSARKEKTPAPESGANGYIPNKVPITITANPMHESDEADVEMSFLHNNNCGNTGSNDDTLPHSRKNSSSNRQYV